MLRERIKELSKGELVIDYRGGPEVISAGEQASASRKSVVDLAWVPAGSYLGQVPCLEAMELSRITALDERKTGFYNTMLDLHKKTGLYYLGRGMPLQEGAGLFYIFTNKKVDTPKDLAGQKIGRGVLALHFLRELGIVSVSVARGEEYTALETKVIHGVVSAMPGLIGYSCQEVVKYVIDHPFGVFNVMTLINLNAWDKLPQHLQKVLTDAQLDVERDWPAKQAEIDAKSWVKLKEAKVEVIKFAPPDAKWFLDTYYRTEWEPLLKKYPDIAPKLKDMVSK